MNAIEFHALEMAYDEASAAIKEAQAAQRAAYEALNAARCNVDFPAPTGHKWRCTMQEGHDGDHSNIYSRGEAVDTPMRW